nr:hypothetical protein [Acrocarpospora macrocephala]
MAVFEHQAEGGVGLAGREGDRHAARAEDTQERDRVVRPVGVVVAQADAIAGREAPFE